MNGGQGKCRCSSAECGIYSPLCARGSCSLNAHLTGVLYTPCVDVYSVCYHQRFPKTSNSKQAEVKHPRFFVCGRLNIKGLSVMGVCGQNRIELLTKKGNTEF